MRSAKPTAERIELARRVAAARSNGSTFRDIAADLGISISYANGLFHDPDGTRARFRKDRLAGVCADCGVEVSYESQRCFACANRAWWTRDRIIHAIRDWHRTAGDPPAAADWNPYDARKRRYAGEHPLWSDNPDRWPYTGTVLAVFGSWNSAIAAAGFTPRKIGGRGKQRWTPRSEHRNRKTTCKRGHDLTDPANVYVYQKTGARACRACRSARASAKDVLRDLREAGL